MQIRELIDNLLGEDSPGFVLRYESSISAAQIIGLVHIPDVVVALLRSDHITASEGKVIQEILVGGKVLLLSITPDAREFPGQLLKAWVGYTEGAFTDAGPSITFDQRLSPLQTQNKKNGVLILIVPNDHAGIKPSDYYQSYWIHSEDLGAGEKFIREVQYTFGLPVEAVTMKGLCFLHHRDPTLAYQKSFREILHNREAITWRDLQTLLRVQPDYDMLRILEQRHKRKELSEKQLAVAYEAVSVTLRERSEIDTRLNGIGLERSIYHLLWFNSWLQRSNRFVFRGQRDTRWRQDITLTRSEGGKPATLEVIIDRLSRTQAFINELAKHELITTPLSDEQNVAIAQHYGMPTPLLDYTRSIEIAAFFATGCGSLPSQSAEDIGVIYYVAADKPLAEPALPNAIDITKEAKFQFGELTSIGVPLPDNNNRIARQQGVFIRGFDSNDLQRLSSRVLYFRHHSNEAYIDERLGITPENLLNPDEELQKPADKIKKASPSYTIPIPLSPILSSVKWPSDNLFGSLGLSLLNNLSTAQQFLNELVNEAEKIDLHLAEGLRNILIRHFAEALIAARTAEVGAPTQQADTATQLDLNLVDDIPDDVYHSVSQVARLADMEPVAFIGKFRNLRPYFYKQEEDHLRTTPLSLKERIAEAVALFIIGLEHLRTVRGDVSMRLFSEASMRLAQNRRFATRHATAD